MKTAITIKQDDTQITRMNSVMHRAGQVANQVAARYAFEDHTDRKASNTIRRKKADLALFEEYLRSAGVPASGLYDNPGAWQGVTWGIVEGFRNWMLQQGYAIGSVNGRLSTVRTFAKLAAKAGAIDPREAMLISAVQGYTRKEAKHIDEKRSQTRKTERIHKGETIKTGKKVEAVVIPEDIAQALKNQPATPQGRRDALIMCLLLDHGLRESEVAQLTRKSFDLKAGTFTFYRQKVDKTQTHTMTPDTRKTAAAYLHYDAPGTGILWRKSSKGTGMLGEQVSTQPGTAEKMIQRRVELLGRHAGLEGLSPHDCRHYWATFEARNGTSLDRLKDAGGWASVAMPDRYVKAAAIANEGTARVK